MTEALEVLHQDDHLVVINKPSGLLVHRGWDRDPVVAMTLVRDLVGAHVYPAHRLDRACSGVVVFARRSDVAGRLGAAFAEGRVHKRYLALVRGVPPDQGVIDRPLRNHETDVEQPARSEFCRLGTFERYSLVEARPHTGRTHQLRRHLRGISHPILGDVRYGSGEHNRIMRARFGMFRLALHAVQLELEHPVSGAPLRLRAPVPADLLGPLEAMGLAPHVTDIGAK